MAPVNKPDRPEAPSKERTYGEGDSLAEKMVARWLGGQDAKPQAAQNYLTT
jgi:hypothetical protein